METKEVIAVVEEQPAIAKRIKGVLGTCSYEIVEVNNMEDLRKHAAMPALVLMDVMMPSGGGKQLLDSIRQTAPGVPVILVADKGGEKDPKLKSASALGVVSYLSQPFKKDELLRKLEETIQAYKSAGATRTRVSPEAHLMAHVRPELHDPHSGRLNVEELAKALDIPVSRLSKAVGVTPAALQKNPAARSIQNALSKVAFCYVTLERLLGSREKTITWLNAPHPDFAARTPLSLIEEGKADAVVGLLEDVLAGQIG